ncbi:hypothetical protein HYH02_006706 [Chlamydomonas schloesseri]|uniref:Uncharacterized protein n=1 Tax=Chlamydomonas schloesseri TaxID=2026947 RepID=A0A835WIN9_9CHLO|nr:hypothetical protein HYH02_006706 [Chlamydomonas schloesseri]|eukprot:KAG2448121.1 hypothetical protein HYH02_006706 [Chlamydomonas schloesseri]
MDVVSNENVSRGIRLDRELAASLASQYPNMGSLDLQHNGIAALEDLRPLGGLTELRLDHNDLRWLEHLQGLSQVTKLSARANAISRLGEDVAGLTALEVLDLADNRLEAGPWVNFLARLPALRDLDLRGNPVCALAGSQELLQAALPGLAVLNGRRVAQQEREQEPQVPTLVPPSPQQQDQLYQQHPYADLGAGLQIGQGYEDVGRLSPGSPEAGLPVGMAPARTNGGAQTNAYLWAGGRETSGAQQWDYAAQQTGDQPQGPPGHVGSSPPPAHLTAEYAVLLAQHERLSQRAALLETSRIAAEDAQLELQQRLHDQASSFAQQAASAAEQISSLVAERDAAVRHADALAAQLMDAQAAAAAAAQDAARLGREASEAEERKQALQQELAATQELLLSQAHQAAVAARSAMDAQAAVASGPHEGAGPGRLRSPARAQAREVSLQALRVSSLQQIVQMQERELVRLGMGAELVPSPPPGSPTSVGQSASPSRSPTARWENLLRPWREQVQVLHEEKARQAAEVAEQRGKWAQQLSEMQEQFMSTRTLIEVLEQRLREQRAEKQQLGLQVRQRAAELESAHRRAAQLEQHLAAREAGMQAVRRQLLAFQAASEQQASAVEARARELDAHASRLGYACQRLVFVLSLQAVRSRGPVAGTHGLDAATDVIQARNAVNSAQGAANRAEGGGRGSGGGGGGTSANCNRPLVAVLQQEVAKMGRDRDVLLKQLAQVSALAEARIHQAQEAMQERESQHREALVATRVQAQVGAMQASFASQVAQMRQQVATAVYAAEEMARSVEAAAGVRLSRMAVRLQEIAKQVTRLRSLTQRDAAAMEAAAAERRQLRQQLAQAEADVAELRRKLAEVDAEAHAKVAELNAAHEAALAAERRRTTDAERLASKAAAECGHMERDLARAREAKVQQEDARSRMLQAQLRDQELQLRSLRRERNSLLCMLKAHGVAISDTSQVVDTQKPWPTDAAVVDVGVGTPSHAHLQHELRDELHHGPQGGTGGLVSSILRGSFHARKGAGLGRVQAGPAQDRLEQLEAMTNELLDS